MTNNDIYHTLQQAFPEHIQPIDMDDHGNAIAQIIVPNQDKHSLKDFDSIGGLIVINQQQSQLDNQNDLKSQDKVSDIDINSKDNQVLLRNFLPHSHHMVNDVDELLAIIDGVIHNEIFWVIEYKLDESGEVDQWHSTTLIDKEDLLENPYVPEAGIVGHVLSWLGDFDTVM